MRLWLVAGRANFFYNGKFHSSNEDGAHSWWFSRYQSTKLFKVVVVLQRCLSIFFGLECFFGSTPSSNLLLAAIFWIDGWRLYTHQQVSYSYMYMNDGLESSGKPHIDPWGTDFRPPKLGLTPSYLVCTQEYLTVWFNQFLVHLFFVEKLQFWNHTPRKNQDQVIQSNLFIL